ncbi:hypothetical protein M409DRAFT_65558 [Zasmidium cellare ATCC 36951]|uniref:P-loop containing nucleoside triphosphate hydrolase protein n=1 Tax=Zasmidium cellare ATCC 36951 TaxID=1080233 RepID=A0A6A6CLA5_ZASCE|nr:uncharacterized protein M409DRAFT_65558 [Zasmidium cellare ATCC 36951]KAF2167994.1 hypothetical protein M409DRAFT_65558 [Zasmidium cellare ATCC 36951]
MHPWLVRVCLFLFPIKESRLKRDRQLRVLALGLPRTGTDSLRQALIDLGFDGVHHGFRMASNRSETPQWVRLAYAAGQFDRVLGNCEAATDVPSAAFATELLCAYPEAKVIVNYRDDMSAWRRSVLDSIEKFLDDQDANWWKWSLQFFDPDIFWARRVHWWLWRRLFDGSFHQDGTDFYQEHYRRIEDVLISQGRPYLKWKVQDGWASLCDFLEMDTPMGTFPCGNGPTDFEARNLLLQKQSLENAQQKARACIALLITAGGFIAAFAAHHIGDKYYRAL